MLAFIKNLIGLNSVIMGKARAIQAFDEALTLRNDGNHKAAFLIFKEAAELGHEGAMSLLGTSYLLGEGTPENGKQAVFWLSKSVELGYEESVSILGMAYATGKSGIKIDLDKASHMLSHAAQRGDDQAARMLSMIEKGEGMFKRFKNKKRK
jgi:TPR repeat protein